VDIIQLLPDNIANQIAAGEVIQRPASAVKELLENAVDAGATSIKLYIQDAGKALIQVVDNGKGMSETDARLAFERHATSKIRKIEDLFQIRTMGFRGEALASVAAVAQVELKSKRKEDELGTLVMIENSQVVRQEPCAAPDGTSIAMKNLFFNVPARRNFLKSNAAEMRHIIDEFIHVAMAFPEIFFALHANGQEMFHLEAGPIKQRVVQLLGNQLNAKLVSVKDQTDYLNITGFIGKPETARKTRGDQYFFVNGRFIKSPYLNHAVSNAFDQLLPKDSFPLYVLFIELDPAEVDINVHPTKQEIKFEDEKIIYAFVQAAVKHALAQASIAPSLDFSLNADIQQLDALNLPFLDDKKQSAEKSDLYQNFTKPHQAHFIEKSKPEKNWQDFFSNTNTSKSDNTDQGSFPAMPQMPSIGQDYFDGPATPFELLSETETARNILAENATFLQIHGTYILAPATSGFLMIHQQIAHERVLYEKLSKQAHGKAVSIQQLLFPSTLRLNPADAVLLTELLPDLQKMGYNIAPGEKNDFTINGIPCDALEGNETHTIELLLEQIKHFSSDVKFSRREKIVRCLARQQAIKAGRSLQQNEMKSLVEELFLCEFSNIGVAGDTPTFVQYKEDALDRMFGRN